MDHLIPMATYQQLIESMQEAVWVGDDQERTLYANPRFCKMLGYSLDEIIGQKSYMFWDKKSAKIVKRENQKRRTMGQSSSYEGILLSKDGSKIPVLLNGTPLPDGGTMGIMTDLSALKRQESIYKTLVTNINEALWMGDKEEKTVYVNPKFCELSGYEEEEIIGKKSYVLWTESSKKFIKKINETVRKKGLSSSYECVLLTKDKKEIPVLVSGTPLADGGTMGIIANLTEIKEKESLEKDNIKLLKLNKLKDNLVKLISKELSTPLQIISQYASKTLLDKKDKMTKNEEVEVRKIQDLSSTLIKVIEESVDQEK